MSEDLQLGGPRFADGPALRASRQLLAELEGTEVFLRVAAAENLPYASMLRMERHAAKRCAQLLAAIDLGAGRTKSLDIPQDDATDELLARDVRGADLAFVRQSTATQVFASAEGSRYEPFDDGPEGAADELVDLQSEESPVRDAPALVTVPPVERDEDTVELLKQQASRAQASEAKQEPTYVSFEESAPIADDGLEELELDEASDDVVHQDTFDLVPDNDDTQPAFVSKRAPPPPPVRDEAPTASALGSTPLTEISVPDRRPSRPPPAVVPPPSSVPPKSRASISVVPTIRDADSPPRPRAAAIQINAGGSGGKVLGLEEEEAPIEIGAAEDDEEGGEVDLAEGFSVTLQTSQELEIEADEEEEEEDGDEGEEQDEVEPLPAASPAPPSSDEIAAILAKARQTANEGRLQHGAELFSDVIDADPDNVDAHVARGRLYLDLGDYSRAMSDFMVAEDIAPTSPEPHVAIGDLYFARKDYRKAIDYFNAALEVSPNHAMAFCRRGISHYYRKNFKEAVDDLLRAEKLDADIPNIQTYVAMAKKKIKK